MRIVRIPAPREIERLIVALSVLMLARPASAQHQPMVWVSTAAIGMDCGTTIAALESDPTIVETNPLLPARPTPTQVVGYCVAGVVASIIVAELLPKKARPWFYGLVAVVGVAHAIHNVREMNKP
ncbi:MAG TPA: hypothetical protein VJ755_03505 [Gemmatimonadales bacterium]|nr:hypothetical protein [Gemmatimonadales bacterium]